MPGRVRAAQLKIAMRAVNLGDAVHCSKSPSLMDFSQ